jgi:hypothetical protein
VAGVKPPWNAKDFQMISKRARKTGGAGIRAGTPALSPEFSEF